MTREPRDSSDILDNDLAAKAANPMQFELATAIFSDWRTFATVQQLEAKFPLRQLPASAMVTRVGPSPTGMMHIGGIYAALINQRLARQTNGVFYLRVEDTDQARYVEGAFETIVRSLTDYRIPPDEGPAITERGIESIGVYGPYVQSLRRDIYRAVVFQMLLTDHAYPSFLTKPQLDELRAQQQDLGITTGLYGEWAASHRTTPETSLELVRRGDPFVVRFNPPNKPAERVHWTDVLRGPMEASDNRLHVVLLKSDSLPTYHLAHVVDDHFMRTTHVIRAEEWLSSVPLHLQLFECLGWTAPNYAHLAALQKQDGSSRRKLSKRKDPEANVMFYQDKGIVSAAVVEYLLNLASPAFEEWRGVNVSAPHTDFSISLERMATAGPLVDIDKLVNINRQLLSRIPIDEFFAEALRWARKHAPDVAAQMDVDPVFTKRALNIERGEGGINSMRYATLADVPIVIRGFFADLLPNVAELEFSGTIAKEDIIAVLHQFESVYPDDLSQEDFFPFLRQIASELNFAASAKDFKTKPATYRGHVGDVAMIVRVAVFGSQRSPDLGHVAAVLGATEVRRRCRRVLAHLSGDNGDNTVAHQDIQ